MKRDSISGFYTQFDERRPEKRSVSFLLMSAESAMLGICLSRMSTDNLKGPYTRSGPLEDTWTDQQTKYWANRMVWC